MSRKSKKTLGSHTTFRFNEHGVGAPAALVAEVEVPITAGPLNGMKVSGIRIWRRKSDPTQQFVTFPGRVYETGEGETRTYEYIRATDGQGETVKVVRAQILEAFREHQEKVSSGK